MCKICTTILLYRVRREGSDAMEDSAIISLFFERSEQAIDELNSYYEDGAVHLWNSWKLSAINIDDVQRIVIGDQILWEAE